MTEETDKSLLTVTGRQQSEIGPREMEPTRFAVDYEPLGWKVDETAVAMAVIAHIESSAKLLDMAPDAFVYALWEWLKDHRAGGIFPQENLS